MDKEALIRHIQQTVKKLPEEKMHEVADFADYLLDKTSKKQGQDISQNLTDLDKKSLSHLENEFKDYRENYPHE